MTITVEDLYKAAALHAYLQRGFSRDDAVTFAQAAATTMIEYDQMIANAKADSYA
jgi:hypothetical protein